MARRQPLTVEEREVAVIDPEDEYQRLCEHVAGTHIALGAPGLCFNPFDLPEGQGADTLIRRALFLQTLIAAMLAEPLTPAARAVLDRAVLAAYRARGIGSDPRTWARPAPVLADLTAQLDHVAGSQAPEAGTAADLSARLTPYTTGSYRNLFAGPTTTRPTGHLVLFSLRDLPDEVRPVGMLLALDTIWRAAANPQARHRRLVVVDEAWTLMREDEGARFLYRLAKSARKHWAGLAVVTQDAGDLLSTDLGRAVIANSATDPAPPSTPGHRPDHRRLRPHRRREDLPSRSRPRPRPAVRNRHRVRPGRLRRHRQPARAPARHHRPRRTRHPHPNPHRSHGGRPPMTRTPLLHDTALFQNTAGGTGLYGILYRSIIELGGMSWGYAAWRYSLITPVTTGLRRMDRRSLSSAGVLMGWHSASGGRCRRAWCGRWPL
ncbi:VirB4 family type IV secretion system protein [Actinomadura sp. GTD37]|uniref:VirB4 family type IV secretion system protein n=1 Tax=Actinomadura sp. GTD37 TaxID=1778030 RepID=UPI0035C05C78